MLGLEDLDAAGDNALGGQETPAELADAYAREAAQAPPAQALPLLLAEGLLRERHLGDLPGAARCYEQALRLQPSNIEAAACARRVAIASGRFADAVRLLEQEVSLLSGPERAAALLVTGLLHGRLGDSAKALAALRDARALQPGNLSFERALYWQCLAASDHLAAYEVLDGLAASVRDPVFRAELHRELGGLAGSKLGHHDVALAHRKAVLERNVADPEARHAVERDLRRGAKSDEVARYYADLGRRLTEPETRALAHYRAARLYRDQLGDEARAISELQAALDHAPNQPLVLAELMRLYEVAGRYAELVDLLRRETSLMQNAEERAHRLYRIGQILEEQLGDVDEALVHYQKVVAIRPSYLPALQALSKAYSRAGKWQELAAMYEAESLATADPLLKVPKLYKLAELIEAKLGDFERAIVLYQQILDVLPGYVPASKALARLLAEHGRVQELVDLYELDAKAARDPQHMLFAAIEPLEKIAALSEDKLNDKERAIDAYKRVLALSPTHLPALRGLGRLYLQKGRWQELADMYRQEVEVTNIPEAAAALHFKMGELYADKLLDEDKAIASFACVLALQPNHRQAIAALSAIFRARGLWQKLCDMLEREAEATHDDVLRAARYFEAADLRESKLSDTLGALVAYEKSLAAVPGFGAAEDGLVAMLLDRGDHERVCTLLRDQLSALPTGPRKYAVAMRLGAIAQSHAQDLAMAEQAYAAAIECKPDDAHAWLQLATVHAQQGEHRKLADAYSRIAGLSAEASIAAAYRLHAALLYELYVGDRAAAEQAYAAVLAVDPNNAVARRASGAMTGATPGGAGLLARATDALVAAAPDEALLEQLIEPLEQSADAQHKAGLALVAPLRLLRRGYGRLGRWREFLGVAEREGALTADHARAAKLLTDVANVSWQKLNDGERAAAAFRQALERDPQSMTAFFGLSELLGSTGKWRELADVLRERKGSRGEFLVEAGSIYFTKLSQPDAARMCFEQALELDAERTDARLALGELAATNGDAIGAVEHLTRALSDRSSSEQTARVHTKLADIYASSLNDRARAQAHARSALQENPLEVDTLERLLATVTKLGDEASRRALLGRLIELTDHPKTKAERMLALSQLIGNEDPAQAERLNAQAAALVPQAPPSDGALLQQYEQSGDWRKLLEVLKATLATAPASEVALRIRLHSRVAAIYADQLKDYALAAVEMKHAVAADPKDIGARERFGLYLAANAQTLPEATTQFRILFEREPLRAQTLRALCRIHSQRGQQDKAYCFAEVMAFFAMADKEERAFYLQSRDRAATLSELALDAEDWRRLRPAGEQGLVGLVEALYGEATELHPVGADRAQIDKADRLTAKSDDPARVLADTVAQVLGVGEFVVLLTDVADPLAVASEGGEPPALLVPRGFSRRASAAEQRYLLGKHLMAMRLSRGLWAGADAAALIAALLNVASPDYEPPEALREAAQRLEKSLRTALSRKAKKAVEAAARPLLGESHPLALTQATLLLDETVARAAVALSGSFETSARMLAAESGRVVPTQFDSSAQLTAFWSGVPGFSRLLQFYLSEEHFALRQKLRLAADC